MIKVELTEDGKAIRVTPDILARNNAVDVAKAREKLSRLFQEKTTVKKCSDL